MENRVAPVSNLRDKILEFVRRYGPVLPVKLAKEIGKDITLTGALLAELVANKKVYISKAKVGGSPLYYMGGQEAKLQSLERYLNSKEAETFRLLREKKLIRDVTAEPSHRVALRSIPDFAVPLNVVTEDGRTELFWKWYLSSDDSIKDLVSQQLQPEAKKIPVREEVKPKQIEVEAGQAVIQEFTPDKQVIKVVRERPKRKPRAMKIVADQIPAAIDAYMNKKKIEVLTREINRKGKEIDMTALVPSEMGKIKFFIAFRNKKKINESDLSLVYSKAQMNGMPAILLSNGEMTKKIKDKLNKEYKSITFYKI